MPQDISLQIRPPRFDLGGQFQAGQADAMDLKRKKHALENDRMQNEMNSMKLKEATGEHNALEQYRMKLKADDPEAIEELSGYPELQKKMFEAFDGMPPKEFMAVRKRANAWADAAQRVFLFPEGTPERKAAELKEIDDLVKKGHLEPAQAAQLRRIGVGALIIDQAFTARDFVEKYHAAKTAKTPEEKEKTRLENERIKADTKRIEAVTEKTAKGKGTDDAKAKEAYFKGQELIEKKEKALGLDKPFDAEMADDAEKAEREKAEAELAAFAAKVEEAFPLPGGAAPKKGAGAAVDEFGNPIEESVNKVGKGGREITAGQPGSKENPIQFKGKTKADIQKEFDALPSGAIFLNPKDGVPLRKP